jgi:fatty acid desaturase
MTTSASAAALPQSASRGVGRVARRDVLLVVLALAHGVVLVAAPSLVLVALGLWWNANTIAHNCIHAPFFASRRLNGLFSCYLSLVLGFPLTLWRERHLAHHAGVASRRGSTRRTAGEAGLVLLAWAWMASRAAGFFVGVYLPGWLLGLGLCVLHGHFEHARGTTSHYGGLYNLLFFNDGYHVEHHQHPAAHWTELPRRAVAGARTSRWPAVLRFLEAIDLELLERLVLRVPALQRFVLRAHERALRRLLPSLPEPRRVVIVGGGVFPRTALVLRRLLPRARLTIVDARADNLELARGFLDAAVRLERRFFDGRRPEDADLVVIPLSLVGDRSRVYDEPPAPAVLVHDWIWARRRPGVRISWLLLKRLNLVRR